MSDQTCSNCIYFKPNPNVSHLLASGECTDPDKVILTSCGRQVGLTPCTKPTNTCTNFTEK